MIKIKTEHNATLSVITIDNITGEGTNDIRLEIDSKYCSGWIHLNENEAKQLINELNEWIND